MPPKKAKKKGKMKPLLVSCMVSSSQPSPSLSLPLLTSKVPTVVDTDTLLQNLTTVATDQHRVVKKHKLLQSHFSIKKARSLPTLTEQTEENVAVDGTVINTTATSVVRSCNNMHAETKPKEKNGPNVPSTPTLLLSSVKSPVSTPINIAKGSEKPRINAQTVTSFPTMTSGRIFLDDPTKTHRLTIDATHLKCLTRFFNFRLNYPLY
jgi:hypothetical protein